MEVIIHIELWKEEELFLSKDQISGYFENNELCFTYDNMEHTISFTAEEMTFKRENNEYRFELIIKEIPECSFLLKETNTLLDIHVERAQFILDDYRVSFDYCIETDDESNGVVITWQEKEV